MFVFYGRILLYGILLCQRKVVKSFENKSVNALEPLTVVTDSENGPDVNDLSKYKHGVDTYQLFCVFNDQSPCTELKYKDQFLWKYSKESDDGNMKSIFYNRYLNLLFMMFEDSCTGYFCNEQGCQLIKKMNFDGFKPSNLTIVTEDKNGLVRENDTSKYDESPFLSFMDYIFNPHVKCVEVKFDNTTVWKHDPNEHGSDYPVRLFMITPFKLISIVFSNYYLFYKLEDNEFNLVCRDDLFPLLETDISLFSEEQGSEKLDDTKYRYVEVPNTPKQVFYLNDETKCTEVRYKDILVWKYDKKQENVYVKLASFNWYRKIAFVQTNSSFYLYMYLDKKFFEILRFPEDNKPEPEETKTPLSPPKPKEEQNMGNKSLKPTEPIKKSLSNKSILLLSLLGAVLFILLLSIALWVLKAI